MTIDKPDLLHKTKRFYTRLSPFGKILSIMIFTGIAFRVVMLCFQYNPFGDDGQRYFQESCNIVYRHIFSSFPDGTTATAHDLPLWPGIMAFYLTITSSVHYTILLAGITNLLLFCNCIYLMIKILSNKPFEYSEKSLCFSLLIFMFIPGSFCYSLFLMPDQIAVFFLLLGLNFYYRGIYQDIKEMYLAAAIWGLAVLSKPICIPFACAFLTAVLFLPKIQWRNKILTFFVTFLIFFVTLFPWILRNKYTFGTAGLTTISGTNLYNCNWKWMVASWKGDKRKSAEQENYLFESNITKQNLDIIAASKAYGKYARSKIIAHLPDYCLHTIKSHPRLYMGSGVAAFLSYFTDIRQKNKYGFLEKCPHETMTQYWTISATVIFSFIWLGICYLIIFFGFVSGTKHFFSTCMKNIQSDRIIAYLSIVLSLILFALIIGPVATTRYRFIMIPFFAILASFIGSGSPKNSKNNCLK